MTHPEDVGKYLDANLTPTAGAINYGNEKMAYMMREELGEEYLPVSLAHVSRFGVSPTIRDASFSVCTVPLMLINNIEGGPLPRKGILATVGAIGVGNLCWVASSDATVFIAQENNIAPEEVPMSDAVNWRKEAGKSIEHCLDLVKSLDIRPQPGDIPFGRPQEPNVDLFNKMNDLMSLNARARIMLSTVMLSGHSRSFVGLEKATNQIEHHLNRGVLASELVKMDATTSRRAVALAKELTARVGALPYMTYTALKEVIIMSRDVLGAVPGNAANLQQAQIEQRRVFAEGADPRVRRAIERRFAGHDEAVSIDVETPDGETLHITGGSITSVIQEIAAHQAQPQPQAPAAAEVNVAQSQSAIDIFPQAQQLDFEILPEGGLEHHIRKMAQAKQERQPKGTKRAQELEVSDRRVQVMKEIVELWGSENVDFYTGNFSKRRKKKIEVQPSAESSDTAGQGKEVEVYDDFILLVLKDYDEQGNLRGEHIIAESPFDTHEHSLFVLRHDVRTGHGVDRDWNEIMKWHKDDVRKAGARRLQHLSSNEIGDAELMAEKVFSLLTCEPDVFPHLEFGGYNAKRKAMRTWVRGGRTALSGQADMPEA